MWQTYRRTLATALSDKRMLIYVLTSTLFVTAVSLMIPYIFKLFFDLVQVSLENGTAQDALPQIIRYAIIYGLALLVETVININQGYAISLWFTRIVNDLQSRNFAHVQTLSLNFFDENSSGKIKERIDKGVLDIANILLWTFTGILPQFAFVVLSTAVLFSINIVFGLTIVAAVPLFIATAVKYYKTIGKFHKKVRKHYEKFTSFAMDNVINISTVKSYTRETANNKRMNSMLKQTYRYVVDREKSSAALRFFRASITDLAKLIIISYGVYLAINGQITTGTLVLVWVYIGRSLDPLYQTAKNIDLIQKALVPAGLTFEFMDTVPEVTDKEDAQKLKVKKGEINVSGLHFSYKSNKVLSGIDLKVPAGSTVAIVGKSGVGKSTLVKLLLRFFDPDRGKIEIDGMDIRDVTQKSLRENVGTVMQDSAVFNDTLYNNLKYGTKRASKEQIERVAKIAHVSDFVDRLSKGYKTIVGERGVKLSGGERQRVNIARALLKNPPILVLDEATSSLDSENEKLIQDALWKLVEGRTTIIIAHRLSTVMKADLIVVMDKGKITEVGTHSDLVKKKGIYARLFEIQSGGYLK